MRLSMLGMGELEASFVELNAAEVVSLLTSGGDIAFHEYAGLTHEINQLVSRNWTLLEFKHVMREANACADYLAKETHHLITGCTSWKDPTVQLESLLLHDKLGASF